MKNATQNLNAKFQKEFAKLRETIKKPNILIIGGTGVGKSSIVNLCFGKDIATHGVGKPVTKYLERFEIDEIPIVLFDTKGYEVGTTAHKEYLENVLSYALDTDGANSHTVHIVWYCIQSSNHRIVDLDISILRALKEAGLPVCVVFTKSDLVTDEEARILQQEIGRSIPNISSVLVSTKKQHGDIDRLINWSLENLPVGLKFAFVAAQKVNFHLKRKRARNVVFQHSGGSAFVGFAPIPFSDAPILLANEAGMIARILFLYDLGALLSSMKGLVASLGVPTIISKTGIWIVGQLFKLIPGLGTIAGGMITASVAAAITAAIGYAIVEFCDRIYLMALEGQIGKLESFLKDADVILTDLVKDHLRKEMSDTDR